MQRCPRPSFSGKLTFLLLLLLHVSRLMCHSDSGDTDTNTEERLRPQLMCKTLCITSRLNNQHLIYFPYYNRGLLETWSDNRPTTCVKSHSSGTETMSLIRERTAEAETFTVSINLLCLLQLLLPQSTSPQLVFFSELLLFCPSLPLLPVLSE
ncbi:hypothetical protein JOB18_004609 [Solea senegalensis]|uniref:Secreted protein n=1 Tax=Solea senegalensis TaxID=28829 RepID=A0AAV6R1C9_SOLSE|nr:hypothetical protein JOB18_004609 [Solea senegalensis]